MSDPARGYLTLAAGSPRYLEMAVDMALSLREHTGVQLAEDADVTDQFFVVDAGGLGFGHQLIDETSTLGHSPEWIDR